jgi:hypothetical protein
MRQRERNRKDKIMEIEIATRVIEHLRCSIREFSTALVGIQESCSEEEAKYYSKAIRTVHADLIGDVIMPILKEHPSLDWIDQIKERLAAHNEDGGTENEEASVPGDREA